MPVIDDYELTIRKNKLMRQYQHYQSYLDNMNSGNVDKSLISAPILGQIEGRSVMQIKDYTSKEAKLFQNYLNSTKEDQLRNNYVNSVKKSEPHLSNKNSIAYKLI